MKRLSIIIPAYNVSAKLERCVESCERQGIPEDDYEIIIINDGSKDNTYTVAMCLAKKYHNILVFTQENRGQSVARNRGIDVARGRYVSFVDADDYLVDNTMLPVLLLSEGKEVDVCMYLMNVQDSAGNWASHAVTAFITNKVYTGEYVMTHKDMSGSCCCSLYRLSFINQNHLHFYPGIVHQDVEFTTRVLALANRIVFSNLPCYVYEYNINSTTRSANFQKIKKGIFDDLIVIANIKKFVRSKKDLNSKIKEHLNKKANSIYIGRFMDILTNEDKRINNLMTEFISVSRELSLLPLRGRTLGWKSFFLMFFINAFVYKKE